MHSILPDYYFTLLEVLVILFLLGGVGVAVYWGMRRRWWNRLKALEQKHADDLAKHDSGYFQELHNHLQSAVAHEFLQPLGDISSKSAQTLEGLGEEQGILRDQQDRIIATADELTQHAANILDLFAPEGGKLQKELLSMRRLVEGVLLGNYRYAQSKGVTLRPNLDDVEPTVLDRHLTLLPLQNVIQNAIKYSHRGGVVEIVLYLEASVQTVDAASEGNASEGESDASVRQSGVYSYYETGLRQLRNRVEDHPRYSEFLVYQQRLTDNIRQSRLYGDIGVRKVERSEIIDCLNELSLSVLGIPFTDLCGPSIGQGPSERLHLERGETKEAGKWICVEVKDTGKGIREEDQHTIFELRKRADGLIETDSGLGLYLARKAARRQGGDVILVRSSLNQGSVFRITFPYSVD